MIMSIKIKLLLQVSHGGTLAVKNLLPKSAEGFYYISCINPFVGTDGI